jgi:hypothetical protein
MVFYGGKFDVSLYVSRVRETKNQTRTAHTSNSANNKFYRDEKEEEIQGEEI